MPGGAAMACAGQLRKTFRIWVVKPGQLSSHCSSEIWSIFLRFLQFLIEIVFFWNDILVYLLLFRWFYRILSYYIYIISFYEYFMKSRSFSKNCSCTRLFDFARGAHCSAILSAAGRALWGMFLALGWKHAVLETAILLKVVVLGEILPVPLTVVSRLTTKMPRKNHRDLSDFTVRGPMMSNDFHPVQFLTRAFKALTVSEGWKGPMALWSTYRSSCRSLQTVGWQTNEHGRGCPTVVYTVSIRAAVTGVWSEGSRFAQLWNKEVTSSTFFNFKHLLLEHVSLWLDYGWIETLPFIERLQKLHKSRALKPLLMRPFTEESWLQLGGTERKQQGRARHGRNGPGSGWSDGWESSRRYWIG